MAAAATPESLGPSAAAPLKRHRQKSAALVIYLRRRQSTQSRLCCWPVPPPIPLAGHVPGCPRVWLALVLPCIADDFLGPPGSDCPGARCFPAPPPVPLAGHVPGCPRLSLALVLPSIAADMCRPCPRLSLALACHRNCNFVASHASTCFQLFPRASPSFDCFGGKRWSRSA